uniref:EF-hand domain-containing protein n=1 Tax=Oryza punctata TaxID=4537 RepID=A0A0E0LXY0_ORYPU
MADYNRYGYGSYSSAPSAPPASSSSSYGYGHGGGGGGYPSSTYPPPPPQQQAYPMGMGMGGFLVFPPGTHPDVERAFRAVDRDGSGSIDERELQDALSSAYHRFSIRTVRLLIFLFNNPASYSPSRMGNLPLLPIASVRQIILSVHRFNHAEKRKFVCLLLACPAEFVSLWNCLGQWRLPIGLISVLGGTIQGIFDRYDRNRSGKIEKDELREALRSLGYAVPPSVLDLLIANYNNGVSSRGALDFDNFVECGMIVKGLTEKFKEKDTRYSGSATLSYDGFLSMVIPFIVP